MELEQIRKEINLLNEEMLRLFEQRMQLCGEVAAYKKAHGMEIFVPAREEEILQWVKEQANPEFSQYDLAFFKALLEWSRNYQQTIIE